MIERYQNPEIVKIWSDENKLELWQRTELAVLQARANLGEIWQEDFQKIFGIWQMHPIDIDWWLKREQEIRHDLQAFLDERLRFLPPELQLLVHKKITSYDTEESAFEQMLKDSIWAVRHRWSIDYVTSIESTLERLARKHRFTIMNARTHGQEAELQSFGKRCLTWLKELRVDMENLRKSAETLEYSKLSGAIGNYGTLDPRIEEEALGLLGFKPFYGATQIMPRELYAPIGQALCQIVLTLDKIGGDIRLGARSGRPLWQEPFGKKQKGSSAMPHKKNTISTEKLKGMARLAKGYSSAIMDNIDTWEERAIEQSSVERVAWPDLFHITIHALETMTQVLEGLRVYPDNMLLEIVECRGCYAASEAKEILKELGLRFGLAAEEAYRIVQLAAFNVFEPGEEAKQLRESPAKSLNEADRLLKRFELIPRPSSLSIKEIISAGALKTSEQLDVSKQDVKKWNEVLEQIFQNIDSRCRWDEIFQPSCLLKNEATLYRKILGEA